MCSTPFTCSLDRQGDGVHHRLRAGAGIAGGDLRPSAARRSGTARPAWRTARPRRAARARCASTLASTGRSMKNLGIMRRRLAADRSASVGSACSGSASVGFVFVGSELYRVAGWRACPAQGRPARRLLTTPAVACVTRAPRQQGPSGDGCPRCGSRAAIGRRVTWSPSPCRRTRRRSSPPPAPLCDRGLRVRRP